MKTAPWSEYFSIVDAELAGDNVILGGTFYGQLPLDNSKYSPIENSEDARSLDASFVASIKLSDCSVNWAVANESKSEATCMVVTGEEIKASTDAATYTFKTATGELKADQTIDQSFNDADCYNDQYVSTVYTNENSVYVFSPHMNPSGIEAAKAAAKNGAAKYYNINGVELSAPQKGLNIVKTADGITKVVM